MDFEFSTDQEDLRALTRQILAGHVTQELLRTVDASEERFDAPTWRALGDANLLGIALPENLGGTGLGLIEQCIVLEEIGRALAPVPIWASCLGAITLATFGNSEQRAKWVPRAATGETILTAALEEPTGHYGDALSTQAKRVGDEWLLSGVKTRVPAGTRASAVIVPAAVDGSVALFILETGTPGLTMTAQRTTTGDALGRLELDDVTVGPDALLGSIEDGPTILQWLWLRAETTICALMLGVCGAALDLTVEYTKTRRQFGRPIATFQAVAHRLADCYIDLQAINLTLWQAAYLLNEGLPAQLAVEAAKFCACDGGQRIVHAAVHVHGGVGTDRDGPVHRYFLNAKQLEFTLGGATEHLLAIGDGIVERSEGRSTDADNVLSSRI